MWSPKWKMWSPRLKHVDFYFKKSVILSLNSSHSIQSSLIVLPDSEYCFCKKFGQLILRIIIKTVATRCQILRLKCIKIQFRLGSAPDPALGAYSAPPDPLAIFKGPTSKGRGGERIWWNRLASRFHCRNQNRWRIPLGIHRTYGCFKFSWNLLNIM